MKLLFDFFPVLLFFLAYKLFGIYIATTVAIAASFIQVGYYWYKHRRVETMHLVTLVLLVVFGGATIILQDEAFIKLKLTIINWLFAAAFLGSQFIGKQPIIQRMMSSANIELPDKVWLNVNIIWVIFFFSLGAINLYVMYNYDTDTWVNFKLFGVYALLVPVLIIQAIYISRHIETDTEEK